MKDKNVSYGDYLQLDRLLSSQKMLSNEHDEMLFIVTHQTYELWFKQLIHEFDALKVFFFQSSFFKALSTLKRIITIIKMLNDQIDLIGTMSPLSFSKFRSKLGSASGFQSLQFREIEFILGFKTETLLMSFTKNSKEWTVLNKRFHTNSIWDEFVLLCKKELLFDRLAICREGTDEIEAILLTIYEIPSLYTEMAECLLDIDKEIQEWRYKHMKTVQRIIGDSIDGTGKTSGFEYLKKSLYKSFCPELWAIRNRISKLAVEQSMND